MNGMRQHKDSFQLMERRPAACFEEAYPIGNGSQGAMVYGDTQNERISLNDDTLWTGYPRTDRFAGEGKASLERAKDHILNGDYVGATAEIRKKFGCYASEAYLPLGDLTISFGGATAKVSGYRRTLDLKRAVVTAKYKRGDVNYSVTAFASNPDKVIVYRIETGADISLTVGLSSQLYSKTYTENGLLCLEGECPASSEQNIARSERKTQYYDEPEKRGVRFLTISDIITDGKKSDRLNAISVKDASYCEFRIFTATSFNGYDKHPFTEGRDYRGICHSMRERLSQKSYEEILNTHVKDHSRYFNRVKLDLGSDNRSATPTSERMRRFEAGEADRALPALLFNFGRYLTIAASRKGSQATNLQGIWNDKYAAPWQSNYTLNINLQMNYFPTLAVGLPEMYAPLIRLIREVSEAGKESARILYGVDGWVCHHNTDLWRHTQPVLGAPYYVFWNAAGGWLCHHLTEYYEYTTDKKFLEKTAYPIMREAVRFYLSQLVTMDGYRIVFPSTSPENSFVSNETRVAISETTEMTMSIVRELFANYLKTCEALGVEDDITATVKDELPRLLPTRISSDGRIMEWYREHTEHDIHHRHLSHLYTFYPAHMLRPDNAPEFCEACRRSIETKGLDGIGWNLAWKANLYAALGDGATAYTLVKKQLHLTNATGISYSVGGGSYTNLFGACPPFQIDSNFGITAAIAEMLIQSDTDTVHVIPAIPKEWDNISVSGLRAKGNRKISFTVCDGELTECEISGSMPSKIIVAGRDMTDRFTPNEKGAKLC